MRIKTTPQEIWNEYEKGVSYNQSQGVNLYETVRQNENFFIGRQWEGVNAPDLEKPVINILKRVVSFFISTIASSAGLVCSSTLFSSIIYLLYTVGLSVVIGVVSNTSSIFSYRIHWGLRHLTTCRPAGSKSTKVAVWHQGHSSVIFHSSL